MPTTEEKSDDVTTTKFGLVDIFSKKKDEKCSAAKHLHVAANW